jgi:hypothetical protein
LNFNPLGGGCQLGSGFCCHFDMGFYWVIKTKMKTDPNSASASSSSLDGDNPSLDKASSSSEEINVSIGFVSVTRFTIGSCLGHRFQPD